MEGPLAAALNESCPNRIYLANDKANEPQSQAAYFGLGANAVETARIARMVPKRHYYYSSAAGKRMFELNLGPIGMELCGSSYTDALLRCDKLARHTGPESFAELWFRGRMDWVSELIAADNRRDVDTIPHALAAE
jgi:type IV secretion system protein VirB4